MDIKKTFSIVLLAVVAGMVISCGGKKQVKEKDIIPREDLVSVLEDIYLANGLFSLRYLRKTFPGTDSLSNYRDILKKYGYTIEDMEKTVDYYNVEERMEELETIYEEVISNLKALQEKSFEEERLGDVPMPVRRDSAGMWPGKGEYHLPREGQRNKIAFTVPLRGPGVYTLSVNIRVNSSDGSKKPYIHLWFRGNDSTGTVRKIAWEKRKITKDGNWHQYVLGKRLSDPKMTFLEGFLLDDENKDTTYIKRADVQNIRLDMKPLRTQKKVPFMK